MTVELKPLEQQTIVITGASSGIGLATARMAAQCGAQVVLAARNERALSDGVDRIQEEGGDATAYVLDVADEERVEQLAEETVHRYGGIDTWVNNAASAIYGRILDVTTEDHRRLFEANYWGTVYGSRAAAKHMNDGGGALINIGSILSERAFPLQGPYSAAKHAVKGFTDALRMELHERGVPISVSLIKPSAIHTLYEDHARNYLERPPRNLPPAYAPETVARAILSCATHPWREVTVGLAGKLITTTGRWFPRFSDWLMERVFVPGQRAEGLSDYGGEQRDNLYEPRPDGRTRGGYPHYAQHVSPFTQARLHPWWTAGILAGLGAAGYCAWSWSRSSGDGHMPEPRAREEREKVEAARARAEAEPGQSVAGRRF